MLLPITLPALLLEANLLRLLQPIGPDLGRATKSTQSHGRRALTDSPKASIFVVEVPEAHPLVAAVLPAVLAGRRVRRALAPDGDALHLAQASKTIHQYDYTQGCRYARHAPETQVGLFHEVLQVHTVQRRHERAST